MAPHPDVFFRVAEEVGERTNDVVAIRDEHFARRALQPPVPEQRHKRRDEEEIAFTRADAPRALDRGPGHLEVGVEHQRHEQRAEPGVVHVAERVRHRAANRHRLVAVSAASSLSARSASRWSCSEGLSASAHAAVTTISALGSRRKPRITSAASSPLTAASALTPARRTSASLSRSASSMPRSHCASVRRQLPPLATRPRTGVTRGAAGAG